MTQKDQSAPKEKKISVEDFFPSFVKVENLHEQYNHIRHIQHILEKSGEKEEGKNLFNEFMQLSKVSIIRKAIFVLAVPITQSTKVSMEYLIDLLESHEKFNEYLQLNFALQLIEAGVILKRVEDIYNKEIIQKLFQQDKELFAPAYLNIRYLINDPVSHENPDFHVISKNYRINAMTQFHLGKNALHLGNYQIAKELFLHSIAFARNHISIKQTAAIYLNLACYLLHDSRYVFEQLRPKDVDVPSDFLRIWDIYDIPFVLDPPSGYNRFIENIKLEHAVRVILDYAQTCRKMPLHVLKDDCEQYYQKAMEFIKSTKEFEIKITDDGVVEFYENFIEPPQFTVEQLHEKMS